MQRWWQKSARGGGALAALVRPGADALLPRVRLFESVRTAHLERAHQLAPATILHQVVRYDFDADLARGLHLVSASPLRSAALVLRGGPREVEVNEPLMLSSLPATALVLAACALRQRLTGRRALVVSYAIGNADPFTAPSGRLRTRVRRRLERRVARVVTRRLDGLVYGTEAARDTYLGLLPEAAGVRSALVPALPAAPTAPLPPKREASVLFLGSLAARKGFPLLVEAWPLVVEQVPDAHLTVVGKGPLLELAQGLAASRPEVDLVVDPPRAEVLAALEASSVLVLPSQASPTWREQVGLPIVEALAAGCAVVTTTETGLASWLDERGHAVLDPGCSAADLADALVGLLRAPLDPADVVSELPDRDGRLAADDWLFAARPGR